MRALTRDELELVAGGNTEYVTVPGGGGYGSGGFPGYDPGGGGGNSGGGGTQTAGGSDPYGVQGKHDGPTPTPHQDYTQRNWHPDWDGWQQVRDANGNMIFEMWHSSDPSFSYSNDGGQTWHEGAGPGGDFVDTPNSESNPSNVLFRPDAIA